MRVCEVLTRMPQNNRFQPTMIQQLAWVGKVVSQIAASKQQQAPTEIDKVLAMRSYRKLKKINGRLYAQRLRHQVAYDKLSLRD